MQDSEPPPLLLLAKEAKAKGIKTMVILGARSPELILYEADFKALGCEVLNSANHHGAKAHATELLEIELVKGDVDCVYTCGPEKMLVRVAELALRHNIDCQVSMERFMKCGFGLCGQCCIDGTGDRVCKDGPVFDGKTALSFVEFGKYTRTCSGKRVELP